MTKKYLLKTYGCQMNVHDSEYIAGVLENLGYESTVDIKETDILILNSCSVRQAAEDSVYGWGKKLKLLEKKPFVILAGCLAGSATGERARITEQYIKAKVPWVDVVLAPSDLFSLPSILPNTPKSTNSPKSLSYKRLGGTHAWVNISSGCDNFCTYCVVPYARKEEVSRSQEEIVREIEDLVKNGYSEFTLLGQNVNSWGLSQDEKFKIRLGSNTKLPFANLLRTICNINGVTKVEFMSSNPFDFTDDLIEALKNPKVSRYLHIAVQSGDDEVLAKMNRRHTAKEFLELVTKIKQAVPDIRIGTDLIVGFPGETEEQFLNTVTLCKKVKFNNAYVAMYSPRLGTVAATFKNDVSLSEKRKRHKVLLGVIKEYKQVF